MREAIQTLEKAHQLEPDNFEVLYNLASLKQERKRMAGAKLYWEKYLKLSTTPKDNFYIQVYKKLRGTVPSKFKEKAEPPKMPEGIRLGALKRFGPPQKIVRHSGGSFYIYDEKGFSIKEVAGNARSYIRFEKKFALFHTSKNFL